jgi:hypothetical protein
MVTRFEGKMLLGIHNKRLFKAIATATSKATAQAAADLSRKYAAVTPVRTGNMRDSWKTIDNINQQNSVLVVNTAFYSGYVYNAQNGRFKQASDQISQEFEQRLSKSLMGELE